MHFNIYLDDETGRHLKAVADQAGETRNSIIRRAVSEWLERQGRPRWPDEILGFKGLTDAPLFEAGRDKLAAPPADPLA